MGFFTGNVYDIDFVEANGWCQYLLRNDEEPMNLVVVTDNHFMHTILSTALVLERAVEIAYDERDNKRLTRVKLNLG